MTTGNVTSDAPVQAPELGREATPTADVSTSSTPAAPKTYSEVEWAKREAEWNKRYSGHDKKLTEVSQSFSKLQVELKQAKEAQRLSEEQAALKAAEANGTDVNVVKRHYEQVRLAEDKTAEISRREEAVKAQEALYADIAMKTKAQELVSTYQLEPTAYEKLLAASNPVEMENAALKLAVAKVKQDGIPQQKVDQSGSVPGQTDIHKIPFHKAVEMLYK